VTRRSNLAHRYVEFIPKEIEEGILYISDRFRTASHLCCCGCGQKVVTPLNPAKWRLTDHGTTVSLAPSIGLGTLPCRSHYWIRRSRVDWYEPMTVGQTARAQRADHYASQIYAGEIVPPASPPKSPPETAPSRWRTFLSWLRSLRPW
jgi:hypothetical protein